MSTPEDDRPDFSLENPATVTEESVILDVRPMLAAGQDPFRVIMAAVQTLPPGKTLKIINDFEPVPLSHVMKGKGFDHRAREADGVFEIEFFRESVSSPVQSEVSAGPAAEAARDVEIDVRGLEPPEPMVRIMEALEHLPAGRRLIVHHHREPMLLYEKLAARGYHAATGKIAEGHFRVTIEPEKSASGRSAPGGRAE